MLDTLSRFINEPYMNIDIQYPTIIGVELPLEKQIHCVALICI